MTDKLDDLLYLSNDLFQKRAYTEVVSLLSDDILAEHNNYHLNSFRSISHFNLANSYHKTDYYKAEKNYKQAIRINPEFVQAHENLGNLYWDTSFDPSGNLELAPFVLLTDAKKHFEEALRIKPDNLAGHKSLAHFLVRYSSLFDKDHKEAIRHSEEALRIAPNDSEAHFNFSIILISAGTHNFNRAKEHYIKATTLDKGLIKPELDKDFSIRR